MRRLPLIIVLAMASFLAPACDPASNKDLAHAMVVAEWKEDGERQFQCMDYIVMHESGYRDDIVSQDSNHDQGIPQAHPTAKNPYPMGRDWKGKPWVQIRWMIDYVKGHVSMWKGRAYRYRDMCGAKAFKVANHWY